MINVGSFKLFFKYMSRISVSFVVIALMFLLISCKAKKKPVIVPLKPLVMVSVLPQAFFVKQLAGDLVDVDVLIPPGANPAHYEPTIKQMTEMANAKIFVKVGHPNFPYEKAWLDKILSANKKIKVVNCSEGIKLLSGDPHIWLSPDNVSILVKTISKALKELFPNRVQKLEGNLNRFQSRLSDLDLKIRRAVSHAQNKRFLVFHPAWGYFARDYGFEQISIQHEGKEPSVHDLSELIKTVKEKHINKIFVQPEFSANSAEVLARELNARVIVLNPLAEDWFNNMERVALMLSSS